MGLGTVSRKPSARLEKCLRSPPRGHLEQDICGGICGKRGRLRKAEVAGGWGGCRGEWCSPLNCRGEGGLGVSTWSNGLA